jgi:hypothetical protein
MKKSSLTIRKNLLPTFLAFVLILVMVSMETALTIPDQTDSTTTVYLDPPTITGTTIGETFTVNVNISNAQNITTWQAGMLFNATLLNCTGFFEGEFLKNVGETYPLQGVIDNVQGVITTYGASFLGDYKASGDGRLAYVNFTVKALGISDLHLRDVKVIDYDHIEVPINIIDVYTIVWSNIQYTVVTVSNSTGKTGTYHSGFYNHAFNSQDKEISFNVSQPSLVWPIRTGFSNITIPKTLMWVDTLDDWKVVIDGTPLSTAERTVTENGTHYSIYFTYGPGVHKIQIISKYSIPSELVVSLIAPTIIAPGASSLLNATVSNRGVNNETDVGLQLLINGTIVNSTVISFLQVGYNSTLSYSWTTPNVEATYNVTAYAPPVTGEIVTLNNVATKFVEVNWFSTIPRSGPIGTKVTAVGADFPAGTQVLVTFNDMSIGYAMTEDFGAFTFIFNVPVSDAGIQTIKAFEATNLSNYVVTTFTVIDITPLDIEIDVGTIHFTGELAEFHILVTFKGVAVNATSIKALLYKPDGTTEALADPSPIATGFYKISYSLVGAQNGTYALVVEASYINVTVKSYGTAFKAFLLSSTLAEELALIEDLGVEIENLKAEIATFNTTLNSLGETLTGELALMEEDLKAQIAALNTTLNSLNEAIAQLETHINTIKSAQEAFTPPLYAAVVLALIAAVGAIGTILLRRKPTP